MSGTTTTTTAATKYDSNIFTGLRSDAGQYVYIVVENGELYPTLYSTYEKAYAAVTTKYEEELSDEREESATWGGNMASQVDVVENTDTGTTKLYIEKEIHIIIQRFNKTE